ncbi:MAG: asparagine synthase C-terminal domain-containing protein [Candidatus Nitrosocosmicus sp.]
MFSTIDYESIMNILTLRYDPNKKPIRDPLSSKDFISKDTNKIESEIIHIIKRDLLQKQQNLKFKEISLALSGGIDSGFTLAMLHSILPDLKIHCVSVGFGDSDDEVARAEEIARVYNCNFYGMIIENIFTDLPKLINIVKEPRWNLYQFYPLEYGKRNSNVFYTGDGGDEIFAGYTFRYNKFLSLFKPNLSWKEKAELYLLCHERDWVPNQLELFGTKLNFSWERIYSFFKNYFDNDLSPLDQVFLSDFNGKLLYDWLPVNNAFEKYIDINIGSVFLTANMIEFATHIPWHKKYDDETITGKLPIRSILLKHKGFGQLTPVKKGFSLDLISLWNKSARDIVNTYINDDSEIVKEGIVKKEWINSAKVKLSDTNVQNDTSRYISKMFSLLALEIWFRLFISKNIKDTQKL